jgi:hypothetical protein
MKQVHNPIATLAANYSYHLNTLCTPSNRALPDKNR